MTDEQRYITGKRAMAAAVLQVILSELGGKERDAEAWRLERAEIIAQLRDLCAKYGDNEWDDDDHLGDVIEKHLARPLAACEMTWRIDWRVPAENAIGGKAYWHPLRGGDTTDPDEARRLYAIAQRTHGADNVRLVRVEECVEA